MTQPSLDLRLSSAEAALQALEQPQLKEKFFIANSKPVGSKVSLLLDEDALEIIIPLREAKLLTVLLGLVALASVTMVVLAMAMYINPSC